MGKILTKKWIEPSIIIRDSRVGNKICRHKNLHRHIIVEGRQKVCICVDTLTHLVKRAITDIK
jgi:hypothetical protein